MCTSGSCLVKRASIVVQLIWLDSEAELNWAHLVVVIHDRCIASVSGVKHTGDPYLPCIFSWIISHAFNGHAKTDCISILRDKHGSFRSSLLGPSCFGVEWFAFWWAASLWGQVLLAIRASLASGSHHCLGHTLWRSAFLLAERSQSPQANGSDEAMLCPNSLTA